jgi:hypothetical protein
LIFVRVGKASYGLCKSGSRRGRDGCIDGKMMVVFNRCSLATYYEKSSLNRNPNCLEIQIAMTTHP